MNGKTKSEAAQRLCATKRRNLFYRIFPRNKTTEDAFFMKKMGVGKKKHNMKKTKTDKTWRSNLEIKSQKDHSGILNISAPRFLLQSRCLIPVDAEDADLFVGKMKKGL